MAYINLLRFHLLLFGFIVVACNFDDKTKHTANAEILPVSSTQKKLNCERDFPPHDIQPYRVFDTCYAADLTLPLKPLPLPAADKIDTVPHISEDPRVYRVDRPRKLSPDTLQRPHRSGFSPFRKNLSLKTVCGLMIDGPRDCDEINRVISGHFATMRYAYNKMLRFDHGLCGNVGFRLVIPASGEVVDCRVIEATMKNTILQDTLVNQLLKWRFDRLPDATDTTVVAFSFWCGS